MSNDAPGAGEPIEIHSCDDVLSHVFEFLDHETDDARRAVIAEHLEDCSSCLREFGIEQEFKALVRRRCGGDAPPAGLRERIKIQLTTVSFEEDGTQVSVERITAERETAGDSASPGPEAPRTASERMRGRSRRPELRLRQALGRLPWLAPFFLRERRLRPRLDIAALLSTCRWAARTVALSRGPGIAPHVMCAASPGPPS